MMSRGVSQSWSGSYDVLRMQWHDFTLNTFGDFWELQIAPVAMLNEDRAVEKGAT